MEFGAGTFAIVFLVVVAVLGPFFGADSRDGRDWRPTGPRPERKRTKRVRERVRRQVALWDAYLTANQPWREHGPMRWRDAGGTWVLDGDTPPDLPHDDADPVPNGKTDGTNDDSDDTDGLRIGPHSDGS